ncbi:MAG: diguanylate cyclase [Clostridiaceae bacterium]|nr:diguanylate cyclase [Clostridiaceae bacterium]
MYIVNNRYRIIKTLTHNALMSAFSAIDIVKNSKPVQLNIINSENLSVDLRDYFLNEFALYKNINSSNILKVYDFETVFSIDNKRDTEENKYYYTKEEFEKDGDISELINNFSEERLFSVFIELCQDINYLHHIGFIYKALIPQNIFISKGENSFKLKDLVTIKIEKSDYWTVIPQYVYYKAPEIVCGEIHSKASDIYALGVLLLSMGLGKMPKEMDVNEEFKNFMAEEQNHKSIFYKLMPVIEKMISFDKGDRFKNISEVISIINAILSSKYALQKIAYLEKLNVNNKMVGRIYEVNTVLEAYKSLVDTQGQSKFVFIHGETGIGKTRLLNRLKHLLSFEKAYIYLSLNSSFNEILKQFVKECDREILSRYENELIKFVPEIGEVKSVLEAESISGEMEKFRLMNRLLNFITECMNGKSTIFIIDNIHLLDEFSLDFIKYIFDRKVKNILFIVTFSDSNNKNKVLNSFWERNRRKNSIIDVALRELTLEETHQLLQYMLSHPNLNIEFSSRIYSKTFGNPKFTEEIMKSLLAKKNIYINSIGLWYTDYSIEKLPLPSNMEQVVLAQIKEFTNSCTLVINAIAIFNTPVPYAILSQLVNEKVSDLEESINFLLNKNIITEKIEDFGYAYDFSNVILKNSIYSRLEKRNRFSMHKKAAEILEEFYNNKRVNSQELIYHLEKCGDKEGIIKYCLANADFMKGLKNRVEEIKNLKRAISSFDKKSIDKRKLSLIVRLAKVYIKEGNYSYAINYFKQAEQNALQIKEHKVLANIFNKLTKIYFLKNDISNSEIYLDKIQELLKEKISEIKSVYMEEYLESVCNKSELLVFYKELKKASNLLQVSLELCGDTYLKQKGVLLRILGRIHFESYKFEFSLACFKESLACFEKIGYIDGATTSLNNIGVIYADCYQEYPRAIHYYLMMKDMSEKNMLIAPHILAIINIGEVYVCLLDYRQAYSYFKEALQMSLKCKYENYTYYCYTCLVDVSMKLGDFKEAHRYYELLIKLIKEYPSLDKWFESYYYASSILFYGFGDSDKAQEFVEKAIIRYEGFSTKPALDCKLLQNYINMCKEKDKDNLSLYIKEIDKIINKFTYAGGKINAMYDVGILFMEKDLKLYATRYLKKAQIQDYQRVHKVVQAKGLYLKGMLSTGIGKLEYLNAALRLSIEENILELKWKILFNIAEYYRNKNKFYAVNYYFEACEVIKLISMKIPEKFQLKWIKKHNALLPFSRLFSIKEPKVLFEVKNIKELQLLLNYEGFNEILTDKALIKVARKLQPHSLPTNIRSVEDLLLNLGPDVKNNFLSICKYLSKITLATKTLIIIDKHEQGFEVFSEDENDQVTLKIKGILERVRDERNTILITSMDMMINNEKAIIATPILSGNTLLGYLYIESDKILNDINKANLEKCLKINQLIRILMEKYQLKINSSIDKLTGTMARKAMEELIEDNIKNSSNSNENFSIIMFDLDYFKSINDRFGHQTGDAVLKNLCKIVLESLNENSSCGRFGGEEFVIILPDMGAVAAVNFGEDLRQKIEGAKILGEKSPVTISMGVATYPLHGESQHELIEKADQALYVAKEMGRNRCQIWQKEFANKTNGINKFAGILTGNSVQDYRNVSVISEVINLIKLEESLDVKIYKLLGRIIETIEAQSGILFLIEDKKVTKTFSRKKFFENWSEIEIYDENILNNVINTGRGDCCINWEENSSYDPLTSLPDWPSVIVIPLINNGNIKGVLYLSVPLRIKEFNFNEYSFVESLAQISTAML